MVFFYDTRANPAQAATFTANLQGTATVHAVVAGTTSTGTTTTTAGMTTTASTTTTTSSTVPE